MDKLGSSVVSGVFKIVVVGKCDSVYDSMWQVEMVSGHDMKWYVGLIYIPPGPQACEET